MTLITLLIVLSIERVAATANIWQFEFYYRKMKSFFLRHLDKPQWLDSFAGMWLWLLLPVLVVYFINVSLDWLLFEFIFNVLVLLICVGCIEKRKIYKSFLNAAARNDETACQLYADQLQGRKISEVFDEADKAADASTEKDESPEVADDAEIEESKAEPVAETVENLDSDNPDSQQAPNSEDEEAQTTQSLPEGCGCETLGLTLVWYNFRYYCAVLFWFVVLGPAGAVLYCVVRESTDDEDEQVRSFLPQDKISKVLHVLDWFPARVCSAGYLLIGNFSKAANTWLGYLLDLTSSAKSLISDISKAAENVDAVDCSKITEPACMLKLAKRNILFFLALVALLTLYGGIR